MIKRSFIITPKEIQRIVGQSYRSATRLHRKIRLHLGKSPHQFLTVDEFCTFTGISLDNVVAALSAT